MATLQNKWSPPPKSPLLTGIRRANTESNDLDEQDNKQRRRFTNLRDALTAAPGMFRRKGARESSDSAPMGRDSKQSSDSTPMRSSSKRESTMSDSDENEAQERRDA